MNAIAVASNPSREVAVDFSRKFIPDALTPLFYTPMFEELALAHRLRYNQLQALYFNEQIIFFETMIGSGIMQSLLHETWPDGFVEKLRQFWTDEVRHSEMFRQLNLRCAPCLYRTGDFHFIKMSSHWLTIIRWATHLPRRFPMFIWLILLQEERSLHYSSEFIRLKEDIEPQFVDTYRAHLIDEAGHVRCDLELLDQWWPHASPRLRKVNAKLLAWLVGEFVSGPKRGQIRVIDTLAWEFPELQERASEMKRQLRDLAGNEHYQLSLYSRDIAPRCFARFDQWPEFRVMESAMSGYRIPLRAVA